jgi:carboxyl-terminal processing protease
MLPASNSGVGMNMGFPDVCVTPVGPVPTPIPYPNMALNATMVPFSPNVLISFVPAVNMGAQAPTTLGDQAGTLSPFMGPGRYTMGHPTVMINGQPGINLLCPTTGNNMINGSGAVLVPSITTVFFSCATAPIPGPVDAAAMTELARAVAAGAVAERVLPGGVLYLAVPVISAGIPARIYSALKRARDVSALLLDLRGCPGGELRSAIELAGDFLEVGAVICTLTDGDGDDTVYRVREGTPHQVPLFVLVDRNTASAAEVFAGVVKAHGRAVVLGERTHGKGTAQELVAGWTAPGAYYATVGSVTLPNREPIAGCGVEPDVEVLDLETALLFCSAHGAAPPGGSATVR